MIAQAILAHPNRTIIEIGPGLGALTRPLVESGRSIIALELDRAFCRYLSEYFERSPNFRLIECDALAKLEEWSRAADWSNVAGPTREVPFVCGNLPYSITTDLLRGVVGVPWLPGGIFLTQLEFAQRITSGSSISSFAVYLGCFGKWNKLRNVGRQFFFPAPSVDSALISFERTEMRCNPSMLEDILRSSFHSKRKKISNSWKSAASLRGLREEWLLELAPAAELDPGLRPEEVPPEKFYELARLVDQQFGAQIRAQA